MIFGADYFKIIQFVIDCLRLFGRIFGDPEDKKNDDQVQGNCRHELEKLHPEPKSPP